MEDSRLTVCETLPLRGTDSLVGICEIALSRKRSECHQKVEGSPFTRESQKISGLLLFLSIIGPSPIRTCMLTAGTVVVTCATAKLDRICIVF